MTHAPGANARQSRTLQTLDRFTPDAVTALAVAGLVLLDAVNTGALVVSDVAAMPRANKMAAIVDRLYRLQDEIHGSGGKLQAALSSLLDLVESEVSHG